MAGMHFIVSYSGGASSWAAARVTRDRVMEDGDHMTLLFADTLVEHQDTYAFLEAGAQNLGVPVTRIADGRTPLEVFRDVRMLGNSRIDPCSRVLKRELLGKWVDAAATQGPITQVIGLDWTEIHRLERFQERNRHPVIAPLIDEGIDKTRVHEMVEAAGLPRQRLYEMGFPHANCSGCCVKSGISNWTLVYRTMPDLYAHWETGEEELRGKLGDVSILKDRRGGDTKPLTLRALRERIEQQPMLIPVDDWGGCGCALE